MKKYILIALLIISCKNKPARPLYDYSKKDSSFIIQGGANSFDTNNSPTIIATFTPVDALVNKCDTVFIHDTIYVKKKIKKEYEVPECDTCPSISIPLKEIQ